jgi:hypothetical protein
LDVHDSLIRNCAGDGILFTPLTSGVLFVSNTHVAGNGDVGIAVLFAGGSTSGAIDHVVVENNGSSGINFFNTGATSFTVSDSIVSNNGIGISLTASANAARVLVRNVVVSNNGGNGVLASGAAALLVIAKSAIFKNGTGFQTLDTGQLVSYGDNELALNGTDGTGAITGTFTPH